MKNKSLIISILSVVIFASFILPSLIKSYRLRCARYCSSIQGNITDLKFGARGFPAVKIDSSDEWIYFGTDIISTPMFSINDSISKQSCSMDILLYKGESVINLSSYRNHYYIDKFCKCEKGMNQINAQDIP